MNDDEWNLFEPGALDFLEGHMMDDNEKKDAIRSMNRRRTKHKTKALMEKAAWPPKDRTIKQWEAHGLDCAIASGAAALCGYVKIPRGHPLHRKHYSHKNVSALAVHGGVTFSQLGEDGGFWIGFDCAHAGDWMAIMDKEVPGRIWTVDDVTVEAEKLAKQLADMHGKKKE